MPSITEVEKLAFELPDSQRTILAAHLLQSLPPVLDDEDEGIAEALRRNAELDANPNIGISLEQFDQHVQARRD
ncbi:hypothetical protein CfE428DRAFT_3349 [Chthoniobacter flavus Ellin428]|uniref:Uncharacterized protein n=1 Tax=Chthoniobacter flavus Ellin428 TaxID=497964 RepID=B4D361_9BACT|nr:addiction module protein [Chthoniobacter flavus]EDY19172.1 hypothetical protein CfE428DRAFT_3349 [Chthoniobacter flavus Ellin428]TCO88018.1 putative addiction module component [Chthoniobacter flavus]